MRGSEGRYFDHVFSEELDDYAPEFLVWPCVGIDLERELRMWAMWKEGHRARLEGRQPSHSEGEFDQLWEESQPNHQPSPQAVLVVPTWQLGSGPGSQGRHFVAWTPV